LSPGTTVYLGGSATVGAGCPAHIVVAVLLITVTDSVHEESEYWSPVNVYVTCVAGRQRFFPSRATPTVQASLRAVSYQPAKLR
jgi:hypothetical protein